MEVFEMEIFEETHFRPDFIATCEFDPAYGEVNCFVNGKSVSPKAYRQAIGRDYRLRTVGSSVDMIASKSNEDA
jgi:hypothetical protein